MRSVTLKSAITPSFMGLMATMLPGVRPSISFASLPTASTSPLFLLMATMDGSLTTMPLFLANTSVLAVPRSMARSDEKRLKRERRFIGKLARLLTICLRRPQVILPFGARMRGCDRDPPVAERSATARKDPGEAQKEAHT